MASRVMDVAMSNVVSLGCEPGQVFLIGHCGTEAFRDQQRVWSSLAVDTDLSLCAMAFPPIKRRISTSIPMYFPTGHGTNNGFRSGLPKRFTLHILTLRTDESGCVSRRSNLLAMLPLNGYASLEPYQDLTFRQER